MVDINAAFTPMVGVQSKRCDFFVVPLQLGVAVMRERCGKIVLRDAVIQTAKFVREVDHLQLHWQKHKGRNFIIVDSHWLPASNSKTIAWLKDALAPIFSNSGNWKARPMLFYFRGQIDTRASYKARHMSSQEAKCSRQRLSASANRILCLRGRATARC